MQVHADGGDGQQGGDGVLDEVSWPAGRGLCRVSEARIQSFSFSFYLCYFVWFFLTNGAVFLRESPSSGRFHLDLLLLEQTEPQEIGLES